MSVVLKYGAVSKMLRDIERSMKTSNALAAACKTRGFRDIIDHFREEKGPEGRWEKRKPSTQKRYEQIRKSRRSKIPNKGKYDPGNKLLQLSGDLRKTIMPGKGGLKKQSWHTVVMFSNSPYSGKHNYGDQQSNLVARPFMWLSQEALDDILTIYMKRTFK